MLRVKEWWIGEGFEDGVRERGREREREREIDR